MHQKAKRTLFMLQRAHCRRQVASWRPWAWTYPLLQGGGRPPSLTKHVRRSPRWAVVDKDSSGLLDGDVNALLQNWNQFVGAFLLHQLATIRKFTESSASSTMHRCRRIIVSEPSLERLSPRGIVERGHKHWTNRTPDTIGHFSRFETEVNLPALLDC